MKYAVCALVGVVCGAGLATGLLRLGDAEVSAGSVPRRDVNGEAKAVAPSTSVDLAAIEARLARIESLLQRPGVGAATLPAGGSASPVAATASTASDPEKAAQAYENQVRAKASAEAILDAALQAGVWTQLDQQRFDKELQPLGPSGLALKPCLFWRAPPASRPNSAFRQR